MGILISTLTTAGKEPAPQIGYPRNVILHFDCRISFRWVWFIIMVLFFGNKYYLIRAPPSLQYILFLSWIPWDLFNPTVTPNKIWHCRWLSYSKGGILTVCVFLFSILYMCIGVPNGLIIWCLIRNRQCVTSLLIFSTLIYSIALALWLHTTKSRSN
jgi:hypothetical protein